MVLFPEVQIQARMAIDQICEQRLPDFSDFETLPYVHALVKEVLRWHQATPLGKATTYSVKIRVYQTGRVGVVHVSSQDDVYKGYYIPKGTNILPNAWSVVNISSPIDLIQLIV